MAQQGIPNDAPPSVGYTITRASRVSDRLVAIELVLPGLQRATITVPYRFTDLDDLRTVIDHAVAGIHRPTKPVGVPGSGV